MKPSFFGSRRAFDAGLPHDGFLLEGRPGALSLTARINGNLHHLEELRGESYRYSDANVQLVIDSAHRITCDPDSTLPVETHFVDVGRVLALITLLRGITDATRIHPVNAPLLVAESQSQTIR
jgi:hypothetical protein